MNSSNLSDFLTGLCSDVKDKEEDEFIGGERGCIAEDGLDPSSLEGTQNRTGRQIARSLKRMLSKIRVSILQMDERQLL